MKGGSVMSKPVLGLILGAILGVFDGLTALFTPEAAPMITSIIMWSSLKGLIAGLIIGFFARKVSALGKGIIFGGAIGLLLAFLVALQPQPSGNHYWIEIMVPGTIVGLILGFATQKYGKEPRPAAAN
jgi:hypothetical protein